MVDVLDYLITDKNSRVAGTYSHARRSFYIRNRN